MILQRAEWIKYLALFFNLEPEAKAIYDQVSCLRAMFIVKVSIVKVSIVKVNIVKVSTVKVSFRDATRYSGSPLDGANQTCVAKCGRCCRSLIGVLCMDVWTKSCICMSSW
jgi:hypothetical protein